MHTTSVVISRRFAEFNGLNVIPSILRIHVQKKEYWLEIKMYVLERQKVGYVTPDCRHGSFVDFTLSPCSECCMLSSG